MGHEDISKHMTKRAAERKKDKLYEEKALGRSSGHERMDYGVERSHDSKLRRWTVYAR